jgi:ketopantoate reductase
MTIDIVGSGAIPSYYGAKLANAGSVAAADGCRERKFCMRCLSQSVQNDLHLPLRDFLPRDRDWAER